jgi:4-hydroxybenzoate polyprenyltransferase
MRTLRLLANLVKLEHTVFALPFAYAGMVLGAATSAATVSVGDVVWWITLAMVGARTFAMGLNRVIDARIDAQNPRTAARDIPAGRVSAVKVLALCAVALALLIAATTQLDPITRVLWPIPVALFVLYPYCKRFTWLCHAVLGLSIGLAPLAAWLAVGAPGDDPAPYLMWLAIATWIGGFDVLYATEDAQFDREHGLNSVPARFGVRAAINITRVAHLITVAALVAVGILLALNVCFWIGLVIGAALLVRENTLLTPTDLSRLDLAFFTLNSWVGVVLGVSLAVGAI